MKPPTQEWRRRLLRPDLPRQRAFTLLELMVVLIVISILVGAVLPEFAGSFTRMQISAAAGQLGDMIAFCFSGAIAQQKDFRLNIEPEAKRAYITYEVELETGELQYQLFPAPGMNIYVLPETVFFDTTDMAEALNPGEQGSYYIQFRRDGTADFCRIRLISQRRDTMEINLNGLTGRVMITEGQPATAEGESGQTPPESVPNEPAPAVYGTEAAV
ncbi:MAG: prepilin-type N-terminal cleavage/methylation domain-containing protein [Candidatus Sumerlaeia bacterium]|nr:prepilin-type N-terminal cleavage/methylation domain-containing protein [Candidatus Sumerlaeia bacterium]